MPAAAATAHAVMDQMQHLSHALQDASRPKDLAESDAAYKARLSAALGLFERVSEVWQAVVRADRPRAPKMMEKSARSAAQVEASKARSGSLLAKPNLPTSAAGPSGSLIVQMHLHAVQPLVPRGFHRGGAGPKLEVAVSQVGGGGRGRASSRGDCAPAEGVGTGSGPRVINFDDMTDAFSASASGAASTAASASSSAVVPQPGPSRVWALGDLASRVWAPVTGVIASMAPSGMPLSLEPAAAPYNDAPTGERASADASRDDGGTGRDEEASAPKRSRGRPARR